MPSRRYLSLLLACLLGCVASLTVMAAPMEATIGATSIKLVLPRGDCPIDSTRAVDAQYLKILLEVTRAGTGNGILAGFADCRQLADWRTGRKAFLDDHGQYQTALKLADREIPGAAMGRICKSLRQQGDQFYQGTSLDQAMRIEQAADALQVGQTRSLGLVSEDENACYSALLQDARARNGAEKRQAGVYATSVVKGKLVYFYLFTPYRDADTLGKLVDVVKSTMRDLQSANAQ